MMLVIAAIAIPCKTAHSDNPAGTDDRKDLVGKGRYTPKDDAWEDVRRFAVHPEGRISWFVDFVDQKPTSELADEALLMAMHVAVVGKQKKEAHGLLDRVIKEYPDSAYTVPLRCVLFSIRGFIPEDEGKLEAHLRDHPNFSADLALLAKARLLESEGKSADAVKLLADYVKKRPKGRCGP